MTTATRIDRTLPKAQRVVACRDCGEAAGFDFMVYDWGTDTGPIYGCERCDQTCGTERRCPDCGRFAKRMAEVVCPEQPNGEPPHDAEVQTLCLCDFCNDGEEVCWYDPDVIEEHMEDAHWQWLEDDVEEPA